MQVFDAWAASSHCSSEIVTWSLPDDAPDSCPYNPCCTIVTIDARQLLPEVPPPSHHVSRDHSQRSHFAQPCQRRRELDAENSRCEDYDVESMIGGSVCEIAHTRPPAIAAAV